MDAYSTRKIEGAEGKAAWILLAIAAIEGTWVGLNWIINGKKFTGYLGFARHRMGALEGWIAAVAVAGIFVLFSIRLPSVREHLFRVSKLKVLGFAVAVAAGVLEEVMFRKWIMDYFLGRGFDGEIQIAASAIAFGLLHGVWGLMGRSIRAALGATVVTGLLGAALAVVYLASGRSLAPCIAAHFLINALVEPGLVLAAVRGEMSRRSAVR